MCGIINVGGWAKIKWGVDHKIENTINVSSVVGKGVPACNREVCRPEKVVHGFGAINSSSSCFNYYLNVKLFRKTILDI